MLDFTRFEVMSFDCYGTLIDWEKGIADDLGALLKRHGIAVDQESLLELYGSLESSIEKGPFIPYREVLREVVRLTSDVFSFELLPGEVDCLVESMGRWKPFPDTVAALERLRKRFQLVVISNVNDDLFAVSQRLLGIRFHRVFTAEKLGSYKPALRNFERSIEEIGVPRGKICHVAQSLYHDIAPASQLGIATVWVNRRGEKRGPGATPQAAAIADLELPDLDSLARLVGDR